MTKANLGNKRQCPSCGARFYDLGKNPAACPKCGKMHDSTIPVRPKRSRSKPPAAPTPAKKPVAKPQPVKEIEDVNLAEFEDIETIGHDEEIEEIEDIEDIDSLGPIEEVGEAGQEEKLEDEAVIEAAPVVPGEVLIDSAEDGEEGEGEEEEEDKKSKSAGKKKKKEKKKR